ncbi:Eco57I restriction-modification methylase domain-containing protein [Agromyces sp. ZXT2-3]|uniref:Eco57I restriction-modification methylase domain-containing protein n=1 Tax=Agromyces sp. ZXT2-3 TaxID=3461152 RepID=UPI004054A4D8
MNHTKSLTLTGARSIAWRDALPTGLTGIEVVFGRDDSDVGEVQIAVANASARPTKAMLEQAWKTRGAAVAMPVIVAAAHSDGVWLFDGRDGILGPVPTGLAERQLQAVLEEPDGIAAQQQIDSVKRQLESGAPGGFSNQFLFASYHLRVNVPKRADWREATGRAAALVTERGRALIAALGFTAEPVSNASGSALVLRTGSGSRRAIAVLLDETEHFEQRSARYQLSPVAHGLEVAGREEVPWLVVLRQSTLRLYPGRDGVGVGQRGQSETYFELDLAMIEPGLAGLLPLIFSADALERGGSAEQILEGSGKYAAELGARLRDRVYLGVVPQIAIAIAERLPQLGYAIDADGLKVAYALTLRVLFRLLFQAYAEDSGLLPAGRNDWYDANSLQAFVEREAKTDAAEFSDSATSIWHDLTQVWDAIYSGNRRWEVPAYGGSLFDPTTEEGALLRRLELPDSVMGRALQEMLVETTEDSIRGAVDFRSLQVREFGTIYEGLLESSLSVAEDDLTVDRSGAFVPAKEHDEIVVRAGAPYFHSASGERKATGSYFTPKVVVDHLIDRSVAPALEAHLAKVHALVEEGKDREAATLFWDFRVADLAMGSAHFLVAAVDKIERGMRDFLTVTPVPGVRAELARLADKAREALDDDVEAASAITEAQLLRRQVARRCVYGLDINPLAVELSRLAIWIHTFVPGLPMSSLDHGLVLGNSLTGIGTIDEALDALAVGELFAPLIREPLDAARTALLDFANASEADRSEVAQGAELLRSAREAAGPARAVFDVAVAMRLGLVAPGTAFSLEDISEIAGNAELREAIERLSPAHLPYLFPEVFLRDAAGFDVLVGNPPWEKLHVEEHQWWGLRIPGLRSMPQSKRRERLAELQAARPDLVKQYRAEIDAVAKVNQAVASGPYPGLGSAHLDLYQAFAWRFWTLIREGGRSAIVVPRGALSGSALATWRRDVLARGSFVDVCFLLNNQSWVFPSVHPQYTVGLTVLERGGDHIARFCGPFASEAEFVVGADSLAEVSADEFASWSSTAAFPLIPDPQSAQIFQQMKQSPRFDDSRAEWRLRPIQGDFNAAGDKDKFEFDLEESDGRIPVLAGASFNIWSPDFGAPFAYGKPEVLRPALLSKLTRASGNPRSAYFGTEWADGKLPLDRSRIAFRDIARATDSRTTIPCLIPPGSVLVHSAPVLVTRAGGAGAEAFALGVLASIPFDWASRRWVELHLTFEVLSSLPVPRYTPGSALSDRVVEIAGRLAAVDDRFESWARQIGVDVGTANTEPVKSDLIAELDALVSLLYELTEEQVRHVFATFHRGWDYQPRLDAVLEYYAAWKDRT